MKGRKPTPIELKIALGNPHHRPINGNAPEPERGLRRPPDHLDAVALAKWEELAHDAGWLAGVDGDTVAAYCVAWSRWVDAELALKKTGAVLKSTEGYYQNPYLAVANRAIEQMRQLGSLLGLNPAERSRLDLSRLGGGEAKPRVSARKRG